MSNAALAVLALQHHMKKLNLQFPGMLQMGLFWLYSALASKCCLHQYTPAKARNERH